MFAAYHVYPIPLLTSFRKSGPEVIKLFFNAQLNFFMLNLDENEIFSANKYENANYSWHFHIY